MASDSRKRPATVPSERRTLDDVDRRLIAALIEDGRRSFAALAVALGLSGDAVRDRLRRLEAAELVRVTARVDPRAIGFETFAMLGLRCAGDIDAAIANLLAIDAVDFAVRSTGPYDLLIELVCRDEAELARRLDREVRVIDGIEIVDSFLYLEFVSWSDTRPASPLALSTTDRALVLGLQRSGRASFRDLAAASGLSYSTTRRRVGELLRAGVIRIEVALDHMVLERDVEAAVGLTLSGPARPAVSALAAGDEFVAAAVLTSGRYDALLSCSCADRRALISGVDRLRKHPHVTRAEVLPYLASLKLPLAWSFPEALTA